MSARVDFAALFASLPESDPDRHDFDPLDEPFAHLAPGYPDSSSPVDFARSVADGFVTAVAWDDAPACRVEDVQTGGSL